MTKPLPRILLALAAALLAFGAAIHAWAYFRTTLRGIQASDLTPFLGNEFKSLWLADSATLAALALIFGVLAARPRAAEGPMVALLALLPAGTAVMLYVFLGGFPAAHLLLACAILVFVAGLMMARPVAAAA